MSRSKTTRRLGRLLPHLVIWLGFLAAVVVIEKNSTTIDSSGPQLILEIDSPKENDLFQVFFDRGAGIHAADSVLRDVTAQEGTIMLPFALPNDPITRIRIDIGQIPGQVRIAAIELNTPDDSRRWSADELYWGVRSTSPRHISKMYREDDVVVFETFGSDPHFFLPMDTVPPPSAGAPAPSQIEIEVRKAEKTQYFQVFYDVGRGINSPDVSSVTIPAGTGLYLAKFSLPDTTIQGLRIDPGTRPGNVWIRSITLTSAHEVRSWRPSELVDSCPAGYRHDISGFRVEDDLLLIVSTGPDPQFRITGFN